MRFTIRRSYNFTTIERKFPHSTSKVNLILFFLLLDSERKKGRNNYLIISVATVEEVFFCFDALFFITNTPHNKMNYLCNKCIHMNSNERQIQIECKRWNL